jgi:hypothetical protein
MESDSTRNYLINQWLPETTPPSQIELWTKLWCDGRLRPLSLPKRGRTWAHMEKILNHQTPSPSHQSDTFERRGGLAGDGRGSPRICDGGYFFLRVRTKAIRSRTCSAVILFRCKVVGMAAMAGGIFRLPFRITLVSSASVLAPT